MLNQDTIEYLSDKVEEFMSRVDSFTSLDIANAAKEAGHWARNHEVANWLRSNVISIAYDGGYLYNQTLIRVDSKAVGMTWAYCYHHHMSDTDDYLDRDQNPKSFVQVVPKTDFASATLAQNLQTQLPATVIYFDTREEAREHARGDDDYKFQDNGIYVTTGTRWSSVRR